MSAQPLVDVSPTTAADVQAMSPGERAAWMASTTGKERWRVLGDPGQPQPPRRPDWADVAACHASRVDLGELTTQAAGADMMAATCARCPVLAWCAAEAREHPAWGLWAGVVLINGRPGRENRGAPRPDVDPADWLTDQLADGPLWLHELLDLGRPLGIGRGRLHRAADTLGIERRKGAPWSLPQQGGAA